VVGREEDGLGGTRGGDCFLRVHPGIFGHFVPGEPLRTGSLMVLSTAEKCLIFYPLCDIM
jgi:hypothetical protein